MVHFGILFLTLSGVVVALAIRPIERESTVGGMQHSIGKLRTSNGNEEPSSARAKFPKRQPVRNYTPNIYSLGISFDVPYLVCSQRAIRDQIVIDTNARENTCFAKRSSVGLVRRFGQSDRENADPVLSNDVECWRSTVIEQYASYPNRSIKSREESLASEWNEVTNAKWPEGNVGPQFIFRLPFTAPPQSDGRYDKGKSESGYGDSTDGNGGSIVFGRPIDESIKPLLFVVFLILAPGISIPLICFGGTWVGWSDYVLILCWAWCGVCLMWAFLQRGREQGGDKNGEHLFYVSKAITSSKSQTCDRSWIRQ